MKRIIRFFRKALDYDRLQYDYSCVLCYATNSRMSYTDYDVNIIYSEIDSAQADFYYNTIKSDIGDMIDKGATIDEIKKYVDNLC